MQLFNIFAALHSSLGLETTHKLNQIYDYLSAEKSQYDPW